MTHSRLPSPELVGEVRDEFVSGRVEAIRREIAAPVVVEKSKKISLMRGLIFPVAIILIWLAITQYRFFNPQAGTSVFELGEIEVLGPTDLCPGESLRFRVNVAVIEDGVYQLAMSTWATDPPATVVFSQGLDMVIADSREFPIEIEWIVPATYISPYTDRPTEWRSGGYSRDVAVTATGRNTSTSTRQVPFKIRSDCSN